MSQNALRVAAALAAALVISISSGPQARAAGDAENGKNLAQRWCAACHVVSSEQRQASVAAPTFASIARQSGFNADKLAFFLLDPHPKMPNMSLTRREASDLAAYIATLGKPD
jgi:mono/diheme cytochrome c family protein